MNVSVNLRHKYLRSFVAAKPAKHEKWLYRFFIYVPLYRCKCFSICIANCKVPSIIILFFFLKATPLYHCNAVMTAPSVQSKKTTIQTNLYAGCLACCRRFNIGLALANEKPIKRVISPGLMRLIMMTLMTENEKRAKTVICHISVRWLRVADWNLWRSYLTVVIIIIIYY